MKKKIYINRCLYIRMFEKIIIFINIIKLIKKKKCLFILLDKINYQNYIYLFDCLYFDNYF
jgi:hypothetical protein